MKASAIFIRHWLSCVLVGCWYSCTGLAFHIVHCKAGPLPINHWDSKVSIQTQRGFHNPWETLVGWLSPSVRWISHRCYGGVRWVCLKICSVSFARLQFHANDHDQRPPVLQEGMIVHSFVPICRNWKLETAMELPTSPQICFACESIAGIAKAMLIGM